MAGIIAGLVLAGHRLPCWGSEALLQIAAGIEVRYTERYDFWVARFMGYFNVNFVPLVVIISPRVLSLFDRCV